MCLAVVKATLATVGRRPQRSVISPSTDDNVELITKSSCRSFLQNFYVIHFDEHNDHLAGKHKKALCQRFGGVAAHVGFISFVNFLHLFVREAFQLFMRKLGAKRLFGVACRNKHSQVFALFWNVVGREQNWKIGGFRTVWSGLQHLHHFVERLMFRISASIN